MPPTGGDKQNLTRLKVTGDGRRAGEEWKSFEIHILGVNLRLVAPRVQEFRLIRREHCVALHAINLRQERVDVPRVVVQDGEFASRSADV